jgi:thioredoxin-related protein
MKKILLSGALTLLLSFTAHIMSAQVTFFTGTWNELFEKAKAENKPVMVFLKLSTCGYCKYTENQIFKRDTAFEYLNENYLCYEVDLKTPEGRKLKNEYDVTMTPSFLFYNSKGKFTRIAEGFHCAAELKNEATKAARKISLKFK